MIGRLCRPPASDQGPAQLVFQVSPSDLSLVIFHSHGSHTHGALILVFGFQSPSPITQATQTVVWTQDLMVGHRVW